MRWAGHVAQTREKRNVYRILVGKPDVKGSLGRRRQRSVYNIKIDLRRRELVDLDWIDQAQDRDQWRGLCEHSNEPSGSMKCWEVFE
jgi:hypothetical protein